MDSNQSGGGQGRQGQSQSGNRNNNNRNRNRNRSRNRNNNNRNRGRNSHNRNRSGGGGGRRRGPAKPPQRTLGQKILAVLTFGILGKPTRKKAGKPKPKSVAQQKPKPANPRKKSGRKVVLHEVTSGRLYVGNLDYAANEDDLETLFSGVGTVLSAEVVINPRTQQSKGFAFVEMNNIDEAKRAVDVLHDQDFMGRALLVSGAKSEGRQSNGGDSSSESSDEAAA